MLIAFNYLDVEQARIFWSRGGHMPWLRWTWSGNTVDATNPTPRPADKYLAQVEDHPRDPDTYV